MATFHPIPVQQQQQQNQQNQQQQPRQQQQLQQLQRQQQQQQPINGGPEDDLPLGATYETANNAKYVNSHHHNNNSISNHNQSSNSNGSHPDLSPSDPKGVELDNAGRVKSGKVRKQCELCGQWSNIKWFFKHMSEVHRALFCRCCREYLPIHEQVTIFYTCSEVRRWVFLILDPT